MSWEGSNDLPSTYNSKCITFFISLNPRTALWTEIILTHFLDEIIGLREGMHLTLGERAKI
jgi:hypothetical protein